jgi:REP element-mobilizing transposase RayT
MRYRRADVAGATYFFTVNLLNRKQTMLQIILIPFATASKPLNNVIHLTSMPW